MGPRRKTDEKRDRITALCEAQGHKCAYCGVLFSQEDDEDYDAEWIDATFDHVVPKSRGGSNCVTNGLAVCTRCNLRKGDKMPTKAQRAILARITPIAFPLYRALREARALRDEQHQQAMQTARRAASYRPAGRDYVEREKKALTGCATPE